LNFRLLLLVSLLTILLLSTAHGEEGNQSLTILSPDLTRKQEILDEEPVLTFIIIGSSDINDISINGQAQDFEPAKTVVLKRKFEFEQGKSLIRIVATDEAGNSTERSFLIGYGDKEVVYETGSEDEAPGLRWKVDVNGGLEMDSNPTNDMSSAIETFDGVVSDDAQDDIRLRLEGIFSAEYEKYNATGGASMIRYSKGDHESLNSLVMFGGIGYKFYLSQGRNWTADAMFTDINVGGFDYAMVQSFSSGIEFLSRGKRGEYRSLKLGGDLIYKLFAISSRESGFQGTLKSTFRSLDLSKNHLFRQLFALGTSTEGTEQSEYTFLKFDFDWKNKWESGLIWDFGFGIQHRTYTNDTSISKDSKLISLGSKPVSIPFQFETGIGWQFSESMKALFNINYVFNLSNDVSYQRLVSGLTVSTVF